MANVSTSQRGRSDYSGAAVGLISFAGILMILGGIFHVIQGLVGLVDDNFYVATHKYIFKFDTTQWGWIHLIAGIIVICAGAALFTGAVWARTVAVIVAALSILANFAWMPWYPFWALTVITFDVFVIWAVTVHGRDVVVSGT